MAVILKFAGSLAGAAVARPISALAVARSFMSAQTRTVEYFGQMD